MADGSRDAENQLLQLRDYCRAKGWEVVGEYVDRLSGKRSDNRREFQRLLREASQHRFDVLVVWALDRLSREGVHATFDHIKRLKGYGVEFESFQEQHFRTTGPAGELMVAIAAWIAEQERIRLSERTRAGLARARKEGRIGGRPRLLLDRNQVLQMDEDGLTQAKIAAKFGVSQPSIGRILKSYGRPFNHLTIGD
jgi:DNA invertase Pin-like site-specific DNA recombinase